MAPRSNIRRTAAAALAALAAMACAVVPTAGAAPEAAGADAGPDARASVVGGRDADARKHPWQVLMTANGKVFCGGALIHPMIVLTAAHCLVDDDGHYFANDRSLTFRAFTGRTRPGAGGAELDLDRARVGPDYDPATDRDDWGLISLDSPASARTIKLAGPTERALWRSGRQALVTGFGLLAGGGSPASVLQQARVPVLPDAACGSYGSAFDPGSMLCAGSRHGRRDTCKGDSGGPLTVATDQGDRRLVGLVSWGLGCAVPGFPGIYTRIGNPYVSGTIADEVAEIEQADGFPADQTGLEVIGSGATPAGCRVAGMAFNQARIAYRSSIQRVKAARSTGSRRRIMVARLRLSKDKIKVQAKRSSMRKACL